MPAAMDPVTAIAKAVDDIVSTVGGIVNTAQKTIAARYAGVVNSNQALQDYTSAQELQYAEIYKLQQQSKNMLIYALVLIAVVITLVIIFRKK